jgi:hypothetical protein
MGRKDTGQGIARFFSGVNLQHPPFCGGVVLIEPVKHHDVRKTVKTQKSIRVIVKNFDSDGSVRFSDSANGNNLKGPLHL